MVVRMVDCIEKEAKESFRRNEIRLFSNLDEYLDEYSRFSDLVLDNFRFVFLYYFLFALLVISIAFVHHGLVLFAKTMIRRRNQSFQAFLHNRLYLAVRQRKQEREIRRIVISYNRLAVNFTGHRTNQADLVQNLNSDSEVNFRSVQRSGK